MSVPATETRGFQAEVSRLLQLMIHSMYSHREIFLRELISNASDACDRLRFAALAEPALAADGAAPEIRVDFDSKERTLTVTDTGIGMTREEAAEHLGTIARSGTAEFFSRLTGDQQQDSQLIGQFGVGFYSAFIVAERVEVLSRRAGTAPDVAVRWSSCGDGEFTLETVSRDERGTAVRLWLREGALEFADAFRLRGLIRRYSDHIAFPVLLRPDGGKGEYDRVNQAQAMWTRPRQELGDDDYRQFYRHVSHDSGDPLAWSHHQVEGRREYTTLLYIPAAAPFDLYNRESPRGLKLYVRRVFIMDDAEQFLPLYLRFVKGVIDSADLPLNVSRELLQQDADVQAIRAAVARRVLDLLARLAAEEPERYQAFWKEFGNVLKEGLVEDPGNRERLLPLLRFSSTIDAGAVPTHALADYLARLRPGQQDIYYLLADSLAAARGSPQLEGLRARGVEVLLLHDRIDPWLVMHLDEFEGHRFVDVGRGELRLDEIAPPEQAPPAPSMALEGLWPRVAARLGDRVAGVRASTRLAESPACLVRDATAAGPQLQRLLEAAGQKLPPARPWLELNPAHALVTRLNLLPDGEAFDSLAALLADQAQIAEGTAPVDPAAFLRRLNAWLLDPRMGTAA
ncbi:MAG: molecular chaperone HtpG [Gammaproteobacteria bacterium]|nr:MAG: molecular chaperone HtpG [Gammaproteobacteria bacterium]